MVNIAIGYFAYLNEGRICKDMELSHFKSELLTIAS